MKTIGNILWLIFAGWETAIAWAIVGLLLCITVVGIPFGVQCFKLAGFTLWPFGRTAVEDPNASPLGAIGNILWFIPGVIISLLYLIGGIGMCLTIIGIPFGIQSFKFIRLALLPFGKEIVRIDDYRNRMTAIPVTDNYPPPAGYVSR